MAQIEPEWRRVARRTPDEVRRVPVEASEAGNGVALRGRGGVISSKSGARKGSEDT
jgi:hypothetical protein